MLKPDEAAEIALLRAGTEDFHGLWELPGVLGHRYHENARMIAHRAASSLAHKGHLAFVWGDPHPNEKQLVSTSELEQVLSNDTFWSGDRPFVGKQVWIFTTEEGEARLRDADVASQDREHVRDQAITAASEVLARGSSGVLVTAVFIGAAMVQLVLGIYRATLLRTTSAPAVAFAIALALVPLLWWVAARHKPGHIFVRPVAIVATLVGILITVAAVGAPFIGLLSRLGFPLLFFGAAATLLSANAERKYAVLAVVALVLFVLAFGGVQLALTYDAQWQVQNRARGINTIWR